MQKTPELLAQNTRNQRSVKARQKRKAQKKALRKTRANSKLLEALKTDEIVCFWGWLPGHKVPNLVVDIETIGLKLP